VALLLEGSEAAAADAASPDDAKRVLAQKLEVALMATIDLVSELLSDKEMFGVRDGLLLQTCEFLVPRLSEALASLGMGSCSMPIPHLSPQQLGAKPRNSRLEPSSIGLLRLPTE
jgi:hypothetical protein